MILALRFKEVDEYVWISENLGTGVGTVTTMICIVPTLPLADSAKDETEMSLLDDEFHSRPQQSGDSKSKRISFQKKR